jgi:transketolase
MQGFGELARAEILYEHFGISIADIVTAAMSLAKNQLRPT